MSIEYPTPRKIVTFGEVLMRLCPPDHQKFAQSKNLEMTFGGGEANVSISLAHMGLEACHVTQFPDNLLGRAATQYLRQYWLDTSYVSLKGDKMGSYFMEVGAGHRASEIVYDRTKSSFADIEPEKIDWSYILEGADWFHWSGITPAISEGAARTCLDAIEVANDLGVKVSGDVHSRKSLWQYGKAPQEIMPTLIARSNYLFGSSFDFAPLYQEIKSDDDLTTTGEKLMKHCPHLMGLIDKDREILSASHNRIRGKYLERGELSVSDWYDVQPIVDRVGTGDAFAAGMIYGLLHFEAPRMRAQYAAAACALKHTIPGDANLASSSDIMALAKGEASGRIKR